MHKEWQASSLFTEAVRNTGVVSLQFVRLVLQLAPSCRQIRPLLLDQRRSLGRKKTPSPQSAGRFEVNVEPVDFHLNVLRKREKLGSMRNDETVAFILRTKTTNEWGHNQKFIYSDTVRSHFWKLSLFTVNMAINKCTVTNREKRISYLNNFLQSNDTTDNPKISKL